MENNQVIINLRTKGNKIQEHKTDFVLPANCRIIQSEYSGIPKEEELELMIKEPGEERKDLPPNGSLYKIISPSNVCQMNIVIDQQTGIVWNDKVVFR